MKRLALLLPLLAVTACASGPPTPLPPPMTEAERAYYNTPRPTVADMDAQAT